jgi:membrane protease YdiL (CAAX protease family)
MILTFITNPYKNSIRNFKKDFTHFLYNIKLLTFIKSLYTDEPFIEDSDLKLYNLKKIFPYLILIPLIEEFSYRGFLRFKNKRFL